MYLDRDVVDRCLCLNWILWKFHLFLNLSPVIPMYFSVLFGTNVVDLVDVVVVVSITVAAAEAVLLLSRFV